MEDLSEGKGFDEVCYNVASKIYTPAQKNLASIARDRLGIVLNEEDYLKSRGALLSFYKLGDKTKKEVRRFSGWEEVQKTVFARRPKSKMLPFYEMNEVLRRAGC